MATPNLKIRTADGVWKRATKLEESSETQLADASSALSIVFK